MVLCFCPASSLQRIGYSFINDHGRGAWENERVHWCFFNVFSELTWVKLVVEYNLKRLSGWDALRSVDLTSVVGEGDLESCWQTWKDLFLAAVKDNIPTKRLRGRNPVPCLTGAVINLIKKEETVRKKLKLHPSESLKSKFQTLRSQVKRAIKESREEFFEAANIEFKINHVSGQY